MEDKKQINEVLKEWYRFVLDNIEKPELSDEQIFNIYWNIKQNIDNTIYQFVVSKHS